MSDTPKVIWAWEYDSQEPVWTLYEVPGAKEYVRADLVQELLNRITELEETISGRYEQMEEEHGD